MSYLKNKLKQKMARYAKRKRRTNTKAKVQYPEARLIVNKSNKYISAEVIDAEGKVVVTISDKTTAGWTKKENAHKAGVALAKALLAKKVKKVFFDRNGYLYHGRIAAFADGLREGGITV